VARAAPAGWELELVDLSLGGQAPALSSFQAFNDARTGELAEVQADMNLDSTSMRVVRPPLPALKTARF